MICNPQMVGMAAASKAPVAFCSEYLLCCACPGWGRHGAFWWYSPTAFQPGGNTPGRTWSPLAPHLVQGTSGSTIFIGVLVNQGLGRWYWLREKVGQVVMQELTSGFQAPPLNDLQPLSHSVVGWCDKARHSKIPCFCR